MAMDIRDSLPVHALAHAEAQAGDETGLLRVGGLVERPQTLSPATLGALPRAPLAERFACEEGWAVEGLRWEGILLR